MATLSEPHEISTGIFNLLNNCNSTKDSGQQTGRTKRHATQLKSPEGGHIGQAGEGERRKCRDWGCPGTEPKPELELRAPCIPELQLSQEREEFELLLLHLCPTVLREGSAYNTAEPSNPGRDLKTKPEGRRVKWGCKLLLSSRGRTAQAWSLLPHTPGACPQSHPPSARSGIVSMSDKKSRIFAVLRTAACKQTGCSKRE